ncbi:hypothetical protein [Foetidibacter luteolus]|uniref:hypothetical protein n=1 Tax=Foetidibacter luteolus TaxID=2608880 RepID=UPI00129B9C51|nr:hypothetical protein [Foetidibacter luteolus]
MGQNNHPKPGWLKFFLSIHIIMIILYVIVLVASEHNYYLRGYRSTSILFLLMTLTGVIFWLLDRREVFGSYFRTALFVVSLIFMACSGILVVEVTHDYDKQLFYEDEKYRMENTDRGIMATCHLPDLFVKHFLYERKYTAVNEVGVACFGKEDVKKFRMQQTSEHEVVVNYYLLNTEIDPLPEMLTIVYKKPK